MFLVAPTRRLPALAPLFAALALVAGGVQAAPAASEPAPDGALIAYGSTSTPVAKLSKRGSTALFLAGAGQFRSDQVQPWTSLVEPGGSWFGPAPTASCGDPSAALSPSALGSRLDAVAADLLFGRQEQARASLDELIPALPCLDGFVDQASLYRLRFLKGALEYLDGRTAAARLELSRAALVDTGATFDESFPPALHDLLVRAKDEVIRRAQVRVVVLLEGAEVRLNGRPVALDSGRGSIDLRPGAHLLQVRSGGVVRSRVLSLEGVAVQPGATVLAVADPAVLGPALAALLAEDGRSSTLGELGGGLLHAWLASRGLPWLLLVDASAGPSAEPTILQVDALTAGVSVYDGRPARGDRFTRRARIALYGGYRGQQPAEGSEDPARSYFEWSLGFWMPVSWVVRTGVTIDMAHTPGSFTDADGQAVSCCTLPELGFRLRGEWPTGWGRPYLELAFIVAWPFVDLTIERPVGQNHAVWGPEGWVGVIFTPGRHRRVGINVGAGGGAATEIRGWLKFRVGAELRF
jgi:hypothetical protein